MREIVALFLLAALLTVALKIALVFLFLAGLIFRTNETVGLIVILAIVAGFRAHPGIGFAIVTVIGAIALYRSISEPPDEPSGPD
jgi:NADH:ubiquinone oxidoreductase subunit 3 (subunit A)